MKNVTVLADFHSMSGIVSALETDNHIHIACQNVNKFAFAFITPLGSDQNINRHNKKLLIF